MPRINQHSQKTPFNDMNFMKSRATFDKPRASELV